MTLNWDPNNCIICNTPLDPVTGDHICTCFSNISTDIANNDHLHLTNNQSIQSSQTTTPIINIFPLEITSNLPLDSNIINTPLLSENNNQLDTPYQSSIHSSSSSIHLLSPYDSNDDDLIDSVNPSELSINFSNNNSPSSHFFLPIRSNSRGHSRNSSISSDFSSYSFDNNNNDSLLFIQNKEKSSVSKLSHSNNNSSTSISSLFARINKSESKISLNDDYSDNEIDKNLNSNNNLNIEKKMKCTICGKLFMNNSKLKSHSLTHSNEKSYKCEYPDCNKAFARHSDLRRHQKTIHSSIEEAESRRRKCGGWSLGTTIFKKGKLYESEIYVNKGKKWGCGDEFLRMDGLVKHWKESKPGSECLESFISLFGDISLNWDEKLKIDLAKRNVLTLKKYEMKET